MKSNFAFGDIYTLSLVKIYIYDLLPSNCYTTTEQQESHIHFRSWMISNLSRTNIFFNFEDGLCRTIPFGITHTLNTVDVQQTFDRIHPLFYIFLAIKLYDSIASLYYQFKRFFEK